ncbi:MAG: DUF1801 domain-containing protein [Rhodanobacteraceae bacterium]|nr:DUF1801 domain-containing protein [Xanthomonadales bacterium]MCP5478955.1 DUF1801 domain-containing protein [Rhodanobacteraceae bacterium]HPF73550.1 hypothetical protein [Xanthomonadaceae bacterium]HPR07420.1 hypothetical protein [Denitromonas sp.]HRX99422.1 hypothetical protein [Xanthomonadaceae bacterium]
MSTEEQVRRYIESFPKPKQSDIGQLHAIILEQNPGVRLWFLDGRDETGKVVSNPSIGYGALDKEYANGKTREFYRVGISANSSGLTVYIMGLTDREYLKNAYGSDIGKAQLTGYCIKFRALKNVDLETLKRAIQDGMARTSA